MASQGLYARAVINCKQEVVCWIVEGPTCVFRPRRETRTKTIHSTNTQRDFIVCKQWMYACVDAVDGDLTVVGTESLLLFVVCFFCIWRWWVTDVGTGVPYVRTRTHARTHNANDDNGMTCAMVVFVATLMMTNNNNSFISVVFRGTANIKNVADDLRFTLYVRVVRSFVCSFVRSCMHTLVRWFVRGKYCCLVLLAICIPAMYGSRI